MEAAGTVAATGASSMSSRFDVVVIGAGPGGYIAAIRAAQLGFKTACIDEWKNDKGGPAPGGTCTNVGCIPSKALLQSSENFENVGHHFSAHGIAVERLTIDIAKMMARKKTVVKQNNDGIVYLFKKNKVTFLHGRGSFAGKGDDGWQIAVAGAEPQTVVAEHVIVATGSNARALPGTDFDEQRILSNDGALAVGAVPKTLGIVGAGVIGLEMGSVWRRLGAEVTILEALPTFLGAVDAQIAAEARKAFDRQGLKIVLGARIGSIEPASAGVSVAYTDASGANRTLACEKLIVSVGRVPNTIGLDAQKVGLEVDDRGFVQADDDCRTNLEKVWAIGDVVRGPMLAHKAEEEGVAVAERIAGQKPHVDFNTVPWVIYTSPEVAWVGKTEKQLQADGRSFRSGSFPFMANGRARAIGDTSGMVKVIADARTDEVLGVHMVGPMVSELIAEAAMAMEFHASAEDIGRICHAHPSLSEATKEAALAVDERALNF